MGQEGLSLPRTLVEGRKAHLAGADVLSWCMPIPLDSEGRAALEAYSCGEMTALELRRRLDGATFGEVLILLGQEGLPLPRTPVEGREAHLARAEKILFGDDDD